MKMSEQDKQALYDNIYDNIYYTVRNYQDTCSHTFGMFLKRRCSIYYDDSAEATASINMETFDMTMNPALIAEKVAGIIIKTVEGGQDPAIVFDKFQGCFSNTFRTNFQVTLTMLFKLFLTLHEIGHYLYSPGISMVKQYYLAYCQSAEKKLQIPFELAFYVTNVVEDLFIQTQFRKEYPGRTYESAFKFGQLYSQGDVGGYGEHVAADDKISIHNKLYYFILRGYNEYNADVLNMWGCPDKLGWSGETCKAFDEAQTFTDKSARLKYTMETVVPLVFKDLLEEVQDVQDSGEASSDSLMDQDKLRVSNNTPTQSMGVPTDVDESVGMPGSSDSADSTNKNGSNSEDTETKNGAGSATAESESESESESDAAQDDNASCCDDSDAPSESNKTYNGDNVHRKPQPKNSASKEFKTEEEILADFAKNLVEACEELNKHLNENGTREYVPPTVFKSNSEDNIKKRQMDAIGCALKEYNEYENCGYNLDKPTMDLYESCSAYFQKLYNLEDYTIHRLEQGEVDPATMIEWYTEKNHQIYAVDIKVNQGRTFQIIFILDMSGSMGSRFTESAKIIAALSHAMDDVRIPSSIYLFDDKSVQIKQLQDPVVLDGSDSSVYSTMIRNRKGGCTNPTGAFDALVYDSVYQTDDTKIVFFLTDGCMDNRNVEETIQSDISELTARGNWFFMCIGIDFCQDDLDRLASFTAPAVCRSYSRKEIVEKLGEDIYNIITENFIKI